MTEVMVKCESCERLFTGLRRLPNGKLLCPECADGQRPPRGSAAASHSSRSSGGIAVFFWVLAWIFGAMGIAAMVGAGGLSGVATALLGAVFGVIASVQQLRTDLHRRWLAEKK
jgi:hypothetical protein